MKRKRYKYRKKEQDFIKHQQRKAGLWPPYIYHPNNRNYDLSCSNRIWGVNKLVIQISNYFILQFERGET